MSGGYPPGAANDSRAPWNSNPRIIGIDEDGDPIYYEPEYEEPEPDYNNENDD